MEHFDLVLRAEKFLRDINCKIVIRDPFKSMTWSGECPDAIGWRGGVSFLIEAKATRADFLSDKKKEFRVFPNKGMGDWRFYMSEPGIIEVDDLPDDWGLLWVYPRKILRVTGFPSNCEYVTRRPFVGDKINENIMLVSALRRLKLRGHFENIYFPRVGSIDEN